MSWEEFWEQYRGFVFWLGGIVVVLGAFLIFVAAGWPGPINNCIWGDGPRQTLTPPSAHASARERAAYSTEVSQLQALVNSGKQNNCYCEAFSVADAAATSGGVRQKTNTWFNLYSIVSSFFVALWVCFDRRAGVTTFIGSRRTYLPDLYIFAVLFLGLGSMWFHGSLKEWGGLTDDLSMYAFVAFLVFYTIRRGICANRWLFWIGYLGAAIGFTVASEIWSLASPSQSSIVSLVLVIGCVAVYAVCELIVIPIMGGGCPWLTSWRWWCGIASIGLATFFWAASQTGAFLCSPGSSFQPHGLLWHPLAGAAALFVYYYWRLDTQDKFQATGGYVDDVPSRYA
jgi:hypothetical protein